MIHRERAETGVEILATAVGELIEDGAPGALRRPEGGLQALVKLAQTLGSVGSDIALLAAAIEVLARRGKPRSRTGLPF